ncbi:MAG: hypothetical protein ACRDYZ_03170 [Acidimicrobiales bacterium]
MCWCASERGDGRNLFPTGKLEELLMGTGAAIDAVSGSFTMDCATVVVTAERDGVG